MEKPRGYLEKVLHRENLKPRDAFQVQAFRFSRGGTFFRYHPRLFHDLSDFGFLEVQGSLPRDHYGTNC